MRTPQQLQLYRKRSYQLQQIEKWRQSSINLILGITIISFLSFLVFTLQFYGISQNQDTAQKMLFEMRSKIALNISQQSSQQNENGKPFQLQQSQHNNDSNSVEVNFQYYYQLYFSKLSKCEEQKQNLLSEYIDLQQQKMHETTGYTFEKDFHLKNIAPDASILKEDQYTSVPYGIYIKKFQSLLFNNKINETYKNIEFILSDSDQQFNFLQITKFTSFFQKRKKEYFKLDGNNSQITAEFNVPHSIKAIGILKLKRKEYNSCEIDTIKVFGLIYNLNKLVIKNEYEKVELLPLIQLEDSDFNKLEDDIIETHYFIIDEQQQRYQSNGFMIEFNNQGHEEYTCVYKIKVFV